MAKGSANENLKLAREIMNEWKKSTGQNRKIIFELDTENKRLKEIISRLPPIISEASSMPNIDDKKTSDPIPEESIINK